VNPKPLDVKLAKHLHAVGVNVAYKNDGEKRPTWERLFPPSIAAWIAVAAEVRKIVEEAKEGK